MNTTARLATYGAVLALLLGAGYATGTAVGPLAAAAPEHGTSADGEAHSGTVVAAQDEAREVLPAGLAASRGGFTFVPTDPTLTPGVAEDFTFRIIGPGGTAVTAFDDNHERRLHLIVVRRDGAGFQHVHPEMAADGTWHVPLTLAAGGSYRAFADFVPTGAAAATTLGVDLMAPGPFDPVPSLPSRTAQVDGYTVELTGELSPGRASPLTLTVHRDGTPVTDLQPYLGAYGHLVALREGDLAYLHVHPEGTPGDGVTPAGPGVAFVAEVPSAGQYRLYLDFQHGGTVHTAEFAVPTGPAVPDAPTTPSGHGADGHGH